MKKNKKIKKNKFFKPNYFVIPIITILVSLIGGYFTDLGMDWYKMLATPAWTPPGAVIGIVWTIIYILTTISALIAWNGFKRDKIFQWIIALFVINAVLNAFWSFLWFTSQLMWAAIIEMIILEATVVALMVLIWPRSRWASILLWPYAVWVIFATFLAVTIWQMNI